MASVEIRQWHDGVELIAINNNSETIRVSIDQEETHEQLTAIFKHLGIDCTYEDSY